MDRGWKFRYADRGLAGATGIAFDDSGWESIEIPHTWNARDGANGRAPVAGNGSSYRRGIGYYRSSIEFDAAWTGKRLFIEFEGANTVSEVFVNGRSAGIHEGGYAAFRFEITDFLRPGRNSLAVSVDNSPTDWIAPIGQEGDFTKMGGIYRDVSLVAVNPARIDLLDYGSSGVYLTPRCMPDGSARVDALVRLANDGDRERQVRVSICLRDEDGLAAGVAEIPVLLRARSKTDASLSIPVPHPKLWDGRANPYLYTATIELREGNRILDSIEETTGIRTVSIDPQRGLFLNGNHLDIHGVNLHQDSFEQGWAMDDRQRDRDYRSIVDLGCTGVRMAHYQHDRHEYDLCDRLGLLVWTEIPLVNKAVPPGEQEPSRRFADNLRQQLTELIRQNYNHPSVFVWGLSNELNQIGPGILDLYKELDSLARQEDPTRLTAYADNQFQGGFRALPADTVGCNRYFGWYQDSAEGLGPWLDSMKGSYGDRLFCVSEYGGGGAISQHKDAIEWKEDIDPTGKRHYEEYQATLHEKSWAALGRRPEIWGAFVWCMFDFASDGREEGDTKGQNDKGLVTRTRELKDAFWFYKSVWNPEPMVHITSKRFSPRPAAVPLVKAYSNAPSLELFVQGQSRGRISRTDLPQDCDTVFTWSNIQLEPGINEIRAVAHFPDGSTREDVASWTSY